MNNSNFKNITLQIYDFDFNEDVWFTNCSFDNVELSMKRNYNYLFNRDGDKLFFFNCKFTGTSTKLTVNRDLTYFSDCTFTSIKKNISYDEYGSFEQIGDNVYQDENITKIYAENSTFNNCNVTVTGQSGTRVIYYHTDCEFNNTSLNRVSGGEIIKNDF